MNEKVVRKLQQIIRRYGVSLCEEPKRCAALLKDLCPQDKREVHVLVLALQAQVAAELLKIPAGVPVSAVLRRLEQRLQDELLLQAEAARWAVGAWAVGAWAVGLGVVQTSVVMPEPVVVVQVQQVINPTINLKPVPSNPHLASKLAVKWSSDSWWKWGVVVVIASVGLLVASNLTNDPVEENLNKSTINRPEGKITEIYNAVLGRDPDLDGLSFYMIKLANGWSIEDIRKDIAFSQESKNRIVSIYANNFCGKEISQIELEKYTLYLSKNHKSTHDITKEMMAHGKEISCK